MDFLFFIKKLIGAMLAPLPLFFFLALVAVLLIVYRSRRSGLWCLSIGLTWLFLSSFFPFAKLLIDPLENSYPAYNGQQVEAVVVLGGWHQTDPRVPVTSILSGFSTSRLLEGIRITKMNSEAPLYLSGYTGFTETLSNAEAMKMLALMLGVEEGRIMTEPRPLDTYEEALFIKERLGSRPFALVTSASHMRRAMALMRKQGLNPIAAPTNYLAKDNGKRSFFSYWPSSGAMRTTFVAIHEWIGYWWSVMNDQIDI